MLDLLLFVFDTFHGGFDSAYAICGRLAYECRSLWFRLYSFLSKPHRIGSGVYLLHRQVFCSLQKMRLVPYRIRLVRNYVQANVPPDKRNIISGGVDLLRTYGRMTGRLLLQFRCIPGTIRYSDVIRQLVRHKKGSILGFVRQYAPLSLSVCKPTEDTLSRRHLRYNLYKLLELSHCVR